MKVLILGATGRTGKHILQYALEKDFDVTCLVRDVSKIQSNSKINLVSGTPNNSNDLEKALKGVDIVISALNISRKSDFPWSRLRTPKNFMSDAMLSLITLQKKYPFKKVIVCSAWGVRETRKDIPFWFRWMIDFSNIGIAYKDHERQEELLESSNLDWTIVRPSGLINSKKLNPIKESFHNTPKPSLFISRRELANYMVNAITDKKLSKKKVVISR